MISQLAAVITETMYGKVGILFCVIIFNVCVHSTPRPENLEDVEEPLDAMRKSISKIKTGLKRISAIVKDIGSNETTHYVCLPQLLNSDVHSEVISTTKVVKGRLVYVNETTWTNGQGEEVAFLRVTDRKPLVSVSREEIDNDNSVTTHERPLKEEPASDK